MNKEYQKTLDWMFTQLPMFQRKGAVAFKKNLDNIRALCAHLGNPQNSFKTIHIAGSNGKGTTAHILAATFQKSGYKTGLYTSPHYVDFRERIKLNGQLMPKENVVKFIRDNQPFLHAFKPSFFEITVAMAFDYFAKEKIDVAIIETGLGGRLDSTNIIIPLLSIITNISLDHQEMLGDTVEKIAVEKAGIIKNGVEVIIGEWQMKVAPIFGMKASCSNSKISFADKNFKWEMPVFRKLEGLDSNPFLRKNIITAYAAFQVLKKKFHLSEADFFFATEHLSELVQYQGRWQIINEDPKAICDSGHNVAGLQMAMERLKMENFNTLHFVIGFVKDKSIDKLIDLLPKNAIYYFCKADIPRGLDAKVILEKCKQSGLKGKSYDSVEKAYISAIENSRKSDLVFVGGSTFIVAEVLGALI